MVRKDKDGIKNTSTNVKAEQKKLSHACSNLWEQEVQKSIIPQRATWRLSIPNFFSSHDHEVNKGTATFIDTRSFS